MSLKPPLKVLHVTYDMRIGGTEQVIRNLIEAADPAELSMSIFCVEEPLGPWGEQLREAGTAIYSCARKPGFDFKVLWALRQCIKEHQIDVVHCHQYTPWVYGALGALGLGKKVIFTEHGRFYPDTASPKRRYINPLLAAVTDHITAISQATRQALVDYEYLREDAISVIYNGIQGLTPTPEAAAQLRRELGIPESAPVVGSIARFDPIKNHRMMLKAFRQVLDQRPDCYLLLVGDGEERAIIESEIEALGLGERVILPGYIAQPATWLEAMDIFLLSSFSEGTSMTLLEAMSLGKPCVVTDVGGNPEIVKEGITGRVAPNADAGAFANATTALLESQNAMSASSTNARARFEQHFTSQKTIGDYKRLYTAL